MILLWALSLFIVAVLPFITYEQYKPNGRKWTGLQTAFFEALSRPIWGMALSWIIFACSCGQGGKQYSGAGIHVETVTQPAPAIHFVLGTEILVPAMGM